MSTNRIMKPIFSGLVFSAIVIGFLSCGDDNSLEELRKNELAKLDTYIQTNYPDVEPTSSGLYYVEEVKGTGDSIVTGDKVQIYYSAWTLDSNLVDETNGFSNGYMFEPIQFIVVPASQLSAQSAVSISDIPGLHEALTSMQLNTIATLILNSGLAFGQNGTVSTDKSISGFTTLIMRVKVDKIYTPN